jgi:hypothetical protein
MYQAGPVTVSVNCDHGHFDQLRGVIELTQQGHLPMHYVVIFPGPHPQNQMSVVTDMD